MFALLQDIDTDFRDLLPRLNRLVYKNEMVPGKFYKALGSDINPKKWTRLFRKYRMRIFFVEDGDTPNISAEFFSDRNKAYITINRAKEYEFNLLKFELVQTVMHELIHAHQFFCHEGQYEKIRTKKIDMDEDEKYLSAFGEIQAFSHCAALEWLVGMNVTEERYEDCTPEVKRALTQNTIRWIRKHAYK